MRPVNDTTPAGRPLAYLAGPLFDEGERWYMERLDATVRSAGIDTFLPHRDNPPKTADNVRQIFDNDRLAIDRCNVVVACLNGVATDDGTAWEIGYAHAIGRPVYGLYTDWRTRFAGETVNLMIECSLTALLRSEEELATALAAWLEAGPPR